MSMWSRPDTARNQQALNDHQRPAVGQTVTWKHYISASAGIPEAGYDGSAFYRQSQITAFFRGVMGAPSTLRQLQTPAGMLPYGTTLIVTREKLDKNDEIIWRGDAFRVESEATPAMMSSAWMAELKRSL